jgi:hypothetical protein
MGTVVEALVSSVSLVELTLSEVLLDEWTSSDVMLVVVTFSDFTGAVEASVSFGIGLLMFLELTFSDPSTVEALAVEVLPLVSTSWSAVT